MGTNLTERKIIRFMRAVLTTQVSWFDRHAMATRWHVNASSDLAPPLTKNAFTPCDALCDTSCVIL